MRVKVRQSVLGGGGGGNVEVERWGEKGEDVNTFCFEGRSNLVQMAPWSLKQFAAAR